MHYRKPSKFTRYLTSTKSCDVPVKPTKIARSARFACRSSRSTMMFGRLNFLTLEISNTYRISSILDVSLACTYFTAIAWTSGSSPANIAQFAGSISKLNSNACDRVLKRILVKKSPLMRASSSIWKFRTNRHPNYSALPVENDFF